MLVLQVTAMTCVLVTERFLVPGMLPIVFCCLLGSVLAADPAHLKPGALSSHLGRVTLVEDVLWVRCPLTALVGVPDHLTAVTEHLTASLSLLEKDLARDVDKSMLLFRLMHARVEFVNEYLLPRTIIVTSLLLTVLNGDSSME